MDGTITTLIILLLAAGLAVTLYMLFKGKPALPAVKKNGTNDPERNERKDAGKASEQYRLIYTRDDAYETKGVEELIARISNVNNPHECARSYIYYDDDLCSRYITIGRDKSNTYTLASPNVDRFAALCIAKVGQEYRLKASSDSRNGISHDFKGERIEGIITFYENVCLYMGNVRIELYVPGHEAAAAQRVKDDILSDLRNAAGQTDTAKTRVWNRSK